MADVDPDECDDLTSPSAKIASLEDQLQQTRYHLDCIVGKLAEAEGNYERVQCENAILQKQVVLLKKELATFTGANNLQAVNSPQGDGTQQCGPTNERDGTDDVIGSDVAHLPDWANSEARDAAPVNIGESLKATAEAALGLSGFVYDESSGLYYNYTSQYYYDPVNCLYYEPHSGTYYSYNQDTQTYEFHSQVEVKQDKHHKHRHRGGRKTRGKEKHGTGEEHDKDRRKRKRDRKSRHKRRTKSRGGRLKEIEDGDEESGKETAKSKHKTKSRSRGNRAKVIEDDGVECTEETATWKHRRKARSRGSRAEEIKDNSDTNDVTMTHNAICDDNKCDNQESETIQKICDVQDASKVENCDLEMETNSAEECDIVSTEPAVNSVICIDEAVESELEDGEISDSSDSSMSSSSYSSYVDSTTSADDDDSARVASLLDAMEEEISTGWPPCVRAMVKSSPHLQVGSLYVITCSGATLGREKDLGHTILIPDTQISKMHCDIQYDVELQKYVLRDHASQNGTLLNRQRISEPKKLSAALPLSHLDTLQVGSSSLELHIHPGTETCDGCEPGQVMAREQQLQQQAAESAPVLSKADKERLRRQKLKSIKKKFGLADCAYVDNSAAIKRDAYEDKASIRRETVGSDHPYQKDDMPASVTRAIPTENKGHKLLAKMGWKEGEGLGKANAGIQQPVHVNFRSDQTAGLGSAGAEWSVDDVVRAKSSQKWRKAQQRFDKLHADKPASKTSVQFVKGESVHPEGNQGNNGSS